MCFVQDVGARQRGATATIILCGVAQRRGGAVRRRRCCYGRARGLTRGPDTERRARVGQAGAESRQRTISTAALAHLVFCAARAKTAGPIQNRWRTTAYARYATRPMVPRYSAPPKVPKRAARARMVALLFSGAGTVAFAKKTPSAPTQPAEQHAAGGPRSPLSTHVIGWWW